MGKRVSIKDIRKQDSVYVRVDAYLKEKLDEVEYQIYRTINSLKLEMVKEINLGSTMPEAFNRATGQL